MKNLLTALVLSCAAFTTASYAADAAKDKPMAAAPAAGSCDAQAADKKLAGAAKNSFVKKCEKDTKGPAMAACETQAGDKKLAGAAKNSFVKKCVADAAK